MSKLPDNATPEKSNRPQGGESTGAWPRLVEALRQEADAQRGAFSPSLHQRIMGAVEATTASRSSASPFDLPHSGSRNWLWVAALAASLLAMAFVGWQIVSQRSSSQFAPLISKDQSSTSNQVASTPDSDEAIDSSDTESSIAATGVQQLLTSSWDANDLMDKAAFGPQLRDDLQHDALLAAELIPHPFVYELAFADDAPAGNSP